MGVKWGNDLGNGDNSIIRDLAVGGIPLNSAVFMTSIDGNLDGDSTTTDLFALESVDGLLLFSLVTNVNEAISLAPSRLAPSLSNNAGRIDIETRISEESGKAGVVDVEAEVGNEENCLGGFADRILTGRAGGTRSPGLALPWLGSILCGRISWGSICSRNGGVSFARLGLVSALKMRSGRLCDVVRVGVHTLVFFFFFLGFSAPSVAGAVSALSVVSPFASASVTSPGTDLGPRLPVDLFLVFFGLGSLSFSSAGFAISTMTERPSRSCPFRASTACWAASMVVRATKP